MRFPPIASMHFVYTMTVVVIVSVCSLLTWRSPDASKQLLTALVIAFILSCVMSTVALFRLIGNHQFFILITVIMAT